MLDIISLLNNRLRELNKIKYLNNGGCAIAAYGIHSFLTRKNIQAEIIYCHSFVHDLKDNAKMLSNKKLGTCSHAQVGFVVDGKVYICDSDGIVKEPMYPHTLICPPKIVEKSINNNGWNTSFDRKNTSKIEKILDVDLSFVDTSPKGVMTSNVSVLEWVKAEIRYKIRKVKRFFKNLKSASIFS